MMKTRFFAAPRRGGRDAAKISLTGDFRAASARDGDENLKTEVRAERLTRAALGHDRAVGSKKCFNSRILLGASPRCHPHPAPHCKGHLERLL